MKELLFTVTALSRETLDAELRTGLGAAYDGLSTCGLQIRVHVLDGADESLTAQIVAQHATRAESGYYRALAVFQAESETFVQAYRARAAQRFTHFKQAMKAIK